MVGGGLGETVLPVSSDDGLAEERGFVELLVLLALLAPLLGGGLGVAPLSLLLSLLLLLRLAGGGPLLLLLGHLLGPLRLLFLVRGLDPLKEARRLVVARGLAGQQDCTSSPPPPPPLQSAPARPPASNFEEWEERAARTLDDVEDAAREEVGREALGVHGALHEGTEQVVQVLRLCHALRVAVGCAPSIS